MSRYPQEFVPTPRKSYGNFAVARTAIDGADGYTIGVSGLRNFEGVAPPIPARGSRHFEATQVEGHWTHNDAEFRILEYLSDNWTQYSRGSVWLYTERQPCPSCSRVLYEQFPVQFPHIELHVYHGR